MCPDRGSDRSGACGGGSDQDAIGAERQLPGRRAGRDLPRLQRLAQHTHLVIAVRNTGSQTIPNVAVTICNVTCAYPAPRARAPTPPRSPPTSARPELANPSRPVWVVDTPPSPPGTPTTLPDGQRAAPAAPSPRTRTRGRSARSSPAQTATFDWAVTAVTPGKHVVAWEVAAGLNGKAKAVLSDGSAARHVHGPDPPRARADVRQQPGKIKTQK